MKLLSTRETAALLGLSRQRVQELAQAGRLPSLLVGNSRVFRPEDVARFRRQPTGRPRKPAQD